jgi:hypothetical protein
MARLIICDYLKTPLKKDDKTFVVVVDGQEFEVGSEGMKALLEQLEGDTPPHGVGVTAPLVTPPKGSSGQVAAIGVHVDDTPLPAQDVPQPMMDDDVPPLEIPDNPRQRFKKPTPAQADKVVNESTKFDEGSLPALTMGAKAQKEAMRKLRELEDEAEAKVRRKAPEGVNLNPEPDRQRRF